MTDEASTDPVTEASCLKAKGNSLFRKGQYLEAVIEFTAGIQLDPANPILYSNRSSAFLKLRQYFYALNDAENTIRLNPKWSKGYYRKGQVEEAAEYYKLARTSYEEGLKVNPCDDGLRKALCDLKMAETTTRSRKRFQVKKYVIFFSTCASLIIAADLHMQTGAFDDQLMRWLFLALSLIFGVILSKFKMSIHSASMKKRLKPPKDLLKQLEKKSENATSSTFSGLSHQYHESDSLVS